MMSKISTYRAAEVRQEKMQAYVFGQVACKWPVFSCRHGTVKNCEVPEIFTLLGS